ncbi:MAG: hypothetical protein ACRDK4_04900 [Solirubrobacteraceae bacterium]
MSGVLEPTLDRESLRVLRAIPECGRDEWARRRLDEAATVWQIAEALNSADLKDVQLTLNGLEHLRYAVSSSSASRKRMVWWRTPKGDRAVGGSA